MAAAAGTGITSLDHSMPARRTSIALPCASRTSTSAAGHARGPVVGNATRIASGPVSRGGIHGDPKPERRHEFRGDTGGALVAIESHRNAPEIGAAGRRKTGGQGQG